MIKDLRAKPLIREIYSKLKNKIEERSLKLTLAVIILGEDPAALFYVKNIEKKGAKVGINVKTYTLPEKTSQNELLNKLNELNNDKIKIITPSNPEERGCQLSIQVKDADKRLHQKLTEANIITDWREPDVIRCAPTPLYNTFEDVYRMVEKLKEILSPS